MNKIKTINLTLEDVPSVEDSIRKINEFALTYDWDESGDQIPQYNIESNFYNLNVSTLRLILYCEQRRWNHFGVNYDNQTEVRVRLLINEIRRKIAGR